MVDRGNGVQETVIASRELRRIQQEHQAQNLPVRAPIPMPAPQRPAIADAEEGETRVALPPPEVAGQIQRNDRLMAVVRRGDHLSAAPKSKRTNCKRCLRCGLEKKGSHHNGGNKSNSKEYCTSEKKQEGWIVPAGYDVDDDRKKARSEAIRQAWAARKKELSIEDEFDFDGWD